MRTTKQIHTRGVFYILFIKDMSFFQIAKFLSRLMEKLDKVDRQLMENGKKLDNVDRQLTEISKWKNETASQLNAFFTKNYWINSPSGLPLDSVVTHWILSWKQ